MCKDVQKESLRVSFKAGYQGYSIVWDIQAEGVHERTCKAERRHLEMMGRASGVEQRAVKALWSHRDNSSRSPLRALHP